MKYSIIITLVSLLLLTGTVYAGETPALETDEQKTIYALGLAIYQRLGLAAFQLTEEDLVILQAGINDSVMGAEIKVDLEVYGPQINTLLQGRVSVAAAKEKEAGKAFLDQEAAKPGAVKLDSGMLYVETEAGSGESPDAGDKVKVHYHGTLRDGTVFDSSLEREPVEFGLGQVVSCFRDGITKMKVGGKSRLVCPSDTAYGDQGSPPAILPGATLVFDVELIEIVAQEAPAPPAAPEVSPNP